MLVHVIIPGKGWGEMDNSTVNIDMAHVFKILNPLKSLKIGTYYLSQLHLML